MRRVRGGFSGWSPTWMETAFDHGSCESPVLDKRRIVSAAGGRAGLTPAFPCGLSSAIPWRVFRVGFLQWGVALSGTAVSSDSSALLGGFRRDSRSGVELESPRREGLDAGTLLCHRSGPGCHETASSELSGWSGTGALQSASHGGYGGRERGAVVALLGRRR